MQFVLFGLDEAWLTFFAGVVLTAVFFVLTPFVTHEYEKWRTRRERFDEQHRGAMWDTAKALLIGSLYARITAGTAARFADAVLDSLLKIKERPEASLLQYTRWFIELTLLRCSAQLADPQHTRQAGIADESARWLVQSTAEHLASHYETFAYIGSNAKTGSISFSVATRFALNGLMDEEPSVEAYFDALAAAAAELEAQRLAVPAIDLGDTDRFITIVKISSGFLAPLYLLTSSLAEFKDQWQSALKGFKRANGPSVVPGRPDLELQKLQAFLWYCWILWGPSIQACTCDKWSGQKALLQHGYGDESNSLPVIVEDDPAERTSLIDQSWASIEKYIIEDGGPPYPLAVQTALYAKIAWGDRYLKRPGVPPILKTTSTGEAAAHDRLLLLCQRAIAGPQAIETSEPYYSAYLWVMFEICDPGKRTGFLNRSWRRFLPIFEHANIANASTLYLLKQQLARKALSTVADMEDRFSQAVDAEEKTHGPTSSSVSALPRTKPVFFRYVCAIDDTGGFRDARTAHQPAFRIPLAEGYRLREIMLKEIKTYESLHAPTMFPELDRPLPDDGKRYASCDLPEILRNFFDYVANPDGS